MSRRLVKNICFLLRQTQLDIVTSGRLLLCLWRQKNRYFWLKLETFTAIFWGGGIYQILPAGYCPEVSSNMFLVAANTAGDVLTSQKVTAEAAKRSCQKHLVLSSRARLLIKYISFFVPINTSAFSNCSRWIVKPPLPPFFPFFAKKCVHSWIGETVWRQTLYNLQGCYSYGNWIIISSLLWRLTYQIRRRLHISKGFRFAKARAK